MLPFVLWGLVATRRLFTRPDYVFWVIAWLGYSAMLILLQMKCGYVAGRYLMPLIPSLGSLAAVGIGEFFRASVVAPRWLLTLLDKIGMSLRPKQRGRVALLAVLLVAIGTSMPAWFRSNHRHRQTYLQAAEWIKEHTQAGEAVFDPINLVSFYADRPNWRPTHPEQPIPVRYAVVDVERVYRTDLCSHGVIKRFNAAGKPVATFVQPKSHRQGVVLHLRMAVGGERRCQRREMALMESNSSTPNVAERRVRPTDRCPLCFSRKSEFVTAPIGSGESTIVECTDCRMMFTSPRPEPDAFDQYYPPDYPQHNLKPRRRRWHTPLREAMQRWLLRSYRGYSDVEEQVSNRRLRAVMFERFARPFLDAYTPPLHGQRRLLDVGCGVGDYLDRMRRLGWTALGVERSATRGRHRAETFRRPGARSRFSARRSRETFF